MMISSSIMIEKQAMKIEKYSHKKSRFCLIQKNWTFTVIGVRRLYGCSAQKLKKRPKAYEGRKGLRGPWER